MSMREWGISDYGLYLDEETVHAIAAKEEDFCEDRWEEEKWDWFEFVRDKTDAIYCGEFSGELYPIDENGFDMDRDSISIEGALYYFGCNYMPSLFKAVYADKNEMIKEFKEKVGTILPDDFDYNAHLVHIVGTDFC